MFVIKHNNFLLVAYVLSFPLLCYHIGDEISKPKMSTFQAVVITMAYAIVGWIIGVSKAKSTIISWIAKAYYWYSVMFLLCMALHLIWGLVILIQSS